MTTNEPTPPLRKASTVILVKQGRPAFEVYLIKRNVKSGFMGGYHVFPGGTVDFEDTGINEWPAFIDIKSGNRLVKRTFHPEVMGVQGINGFRIMHRRHS